MSVALIGVPFDLDQPAQGKGLAPQAMLNAGLIARLETLGVHIAQTTIIEGELPAGTVEARIGVMLGWLARAVQTAREQRLLPVVLGGDCLTALGTLGGIGGGTQSGIAWLDAHGDFNTPQSTLSGYLGGMPLAAAVGRELLQLRSAAQLLQPISESQVALIGVRDLDEPEKALLADSEVSVLSAMDLNQRNGDIDGAMTLLKRIEQLYLHIDIDVLNNQDAPGVDYPAPGGLEPHTLIDLVTQIAQNGQIAAIALTALNPERDINEQTLGHALDVLCAAVSAAEAV